MATQCKKCGGIVGDINFGGIDYLHPCNNHRKPDYNIIPPKRRREIEDEVIDVQKRIKKFS